MRNIGILDIYKLLLNNPADIVAYHIRDNAENVVGSLLLLDEVVHIKGLYSEELAAGKPFTLLFATHYDTLQRKSNGHTIPELPTRVKNFSKAIFKFVVSGFPVATKAEAQRKLEICETNECGYFDGSICRHTKCGCFSKIKTFFETENCPIGKW